MNARSLFSVHDYAPLPPLVRVPGDPILSPRSDLRFNCPFSGPDTPWADVSLTNPSVVAYGGGYAMIVRAIGSKPEASHNRDRLGLATSRDGLNFEMHPQPVLAPAKDEWEAIEAPTGLQDPRVIELEDGTFAMNYGCWDRETCTLMSATSKDMVHWTKHGPAFARALGGKYLRYWSKAGAVVSEYRDGRFIAKRLGGKYVMYWGESDIYLAESDDGIHWEPREYLAGACKHLKFDRGRYINSFLGGHRTPEPVLRPRKGAFDAFLVEPGPQAVMTSDGILLIYNGNLPRILPSGREIEEYAFGAVLFDPRDPGHVIWRTSTPMLRPELPFEQEGLVPYVVFCSAMAAQGDRLRFYYGCGDVHVHAAECELPESFVSV